MIYLHGTFVKRNFHVWGESEADPSGKQKWPYALSVDLLAEVLSRIGLRNGEPGVITGWFPAPGRKALPSSPLFGEVRTGNTQVALKSWVIPTMKMASDTVLEFLQIEESKIENGLFYGNDLLYWSHALRLVHRLMYHQKFLPWLEDGEARWVPFLAGEDLEFFNDLARAMPPFCRAFSTDRAGPPADSSLTKLLDFTTFFLDSLVRASANHNVSQSFPPNVHDRWLMALQQRYPVVDASQNDLKKLEMSLHTWAQPLLRLANFPYRVAFRLEEPGLKRNWYLRYFLQKQDDLSLLIPATHLWRNKKSARQILKSDFHRAQENLLSELAQAGHIDPHIETSLHSESPEGYETDVKGAWEFLETKAWILQDSGYGVLLPSWWGRKKRLSLKGKAKSSTPKGFGAVGPQVLIDFDWKFAIGDQEITYKELMALAKLKQQLVKHRGKWIALRPEEIASAISFWKSKELQSGNLFDLLKLSFGMQELGGLPVDGVEVDGWVADFLHNFQEHSKYVLKDVPGTFHGELRPYQHRGYSWLHFMKSFGIGSCLADDMGLGKTIQTIALMLSDRIHSSDPFLIVCPTSVVGNWQRELERFGPDLRVEVHHGATRKKGEEFAKHLQSTDVLVSSYSLLVRDFEIFRNTKWRAVILDEAQNIKNAETKQARAARSIAADYRIALTGTPVENHIGELWSIMEFLNRGLLGNKSEFQRKYFFPIHKEGNQEVMEELKRITGPFLLRRLKSDPDIISDLPKKMEMKVFCNLTREQASLYAAVVRELDSELDELDGIERKGKILAALTKLKQICNHPAHFLSDGSPLEGRSGKLARLTEMLDEVLQTGERALVFTQFAQMGELLRVHMENYFGKETAFLHGAVPRKKREEMVARFHHDDDGPPIFVLSLKAGGTGLNLTAANHVFHFDRWWNPAVEDQATDRAYRIGQTKNVQVHKYVCVGTLEERIDQILENKKNMAQSLIGTGEAWLTELSTTEIRSLIALSKDAVAV